jgi:hypothetical protein
LVNGVRLPVHEQDIVTLDANPGPSTITLTRNCTYSFTAAAYRANRARVSRYGPAALSAIAVEITIEGLATTIQRNVAVIPDFRVLFVGADPANAKNLYFAAPGE